jgi:hypothetical protein
VSSRRDRAGRVGRGHRIRQNDVLIPCEECVTSTGHTYRFIIPKHKSGRDVYIELIRGSGIVQVWGPAVRGCPG